MEEEQSPERVKELLREAFETGRAVTLRIEKLEGGEAVPTPDLGIMDMDETHVELTSVDENGESGASGWVQIQRIKRVK